MPFRFINQVGIELEGQWDEARMPRNLGTDGSLHGFSGNGITGEARSRPMTSRWAEWVRETYPDRVNISCGLHVHLSFRTEYQVMRLMDSQFRDYFMPRMRRWGVRNELPAEHAFFSRLAGRNQYCRSGWEPDAGVRGLIERYCGINFVAIRVHGTVEFRFLPMFPSRQIDLSIDAIRHLIRTVENYLNWQSRFVEPEITAAVEREEDEPDIPGLATPEVAELTDHIPLTSVMPVEIVDERVDAEGVIEECV